MKRLTISLLVLLLACCGGNTRSLKIEDEIRIPEGYTFAGAAEYGIMDGIVTVYCKKDGTNQIFECTDGKIGYEYIVPEGYFFLGVSAYGQYKPISTFYCGKEDTDRVYICNWVGQ